jgi:hypothetical protein
LEVRVQVSSFVAASAVAIGFMLSSRLPSANAQESAPESPAKVNAQSEWAAVDKAMGRNGAMQPGNVQRYSFPRSDLHVITQGVTVKPALALGSWVALKRLGGSSGHAMAMGDLVLVQDEVMPVIAKLQAMGVEQTALHNHLQHESPPVMYLHIQAVGDPVKIAQAVRAALDLTKTPPMPKSPAISAALGLDTASLASALGHSGKVNGGVYQVSVPRAEPVRMDGMELPPAMGVATALNFQPTGNGKAAITGDFVLTADEVNPVIKALQEGGIAVTALHSHMLGEEPRLFFMHFWANDDAMKLTQTLHAALAHMKVRTPGA